MTGPYITVIIGKDGRQPKEDPGDELRAETDRARKCSASEIARQLALHTASKLARYTDCRT